MKSSIFVSWLVEGLKKEGRSQVGLARHTGISPSVINRMVLGKRPIRERELMQISAYFGEPLPNSSSARYSNMPVGFELVPVVGVAQHDVWREDVGSALKPLVTELPVVSSQPYGGVRKAVQLAIPLDQGLQVKSQFFIFVPIAKVERKLRDGDTVYAEIRRDRFIQQTILRVETSEVGTLLHPIASEGEPRKAKDVKIIGLVTGTHTEYHS
jgi:transcriptional regulator with XRE-family HTH domain